MTNKFSFNFKIDRDKYELIFRVFVADFGLLELILKASGHSNLKVLP